LFGIISYCSINVILIHKLNSFTGVLTLYARIMLHHIAHLRQVSQLKISDFSGENFKGFEVL